MPAMNDPTSPDPLPAPVPHGGNLSDAVRRYGIARDRWTDLSTGINPHGYPVPPIDPAAWLRLPDDDDDLEPIAAQYYGARHTLAVAGTQAAIRMLPQCLPRGTVAIHALTYGEYAPAFVHAGFDVEHFVDASIVAEATAGAGAGAGATHPHRLEPGAALPSHWRHLVIVNPNNPTTQQFDVDTLLTWHRELVRRGGTLIVDEAFADAVPEHSVAPYADMPGIIVLRSVGKFFGLAGARAGFLVADMRTLDAARHLRGPWSVSGPARAVVRSALLDTEWQHAMRVRLEHDSTRLQALLESHGLCACRTSLFAWIADPDAATRHDRLAKTGVWVRQFERVASLRIGLPGDETGWKALSAGLLAART